MYRFILAILTVIAPLRAQQMAIAAPAPEQETYLHLLDPGVLAHVLILTAANGERSTITPIQKNSVRWWMPENLKYYWRDLADERDWREQGAVLIKSSQVNVSRNRLIQANSRALGVEFSEFSDLGQTHYRKSLIFTHGALRGIMHNLLELDPQWLSRETLLKAIETELKEHVINSEDFSREYKKLIGVLKEQYGTSERRILTCEKFLRHGIALFAAMVTFMICYKFYPEGSGF